MTLQAIERPHEAPTAVYRQVRVRRPLSALQLGHHWFTQRPGGLDRYVANLVAHQPSDWNTRVLALRAAANDEQVPACVRFYAGARECRKRRAKALQRAFQEAIHEQRPDVIVSHFAQVVYPVHKHRAFEQVPLIEHFHGPWADESLCEGAGWLNALLKRRQERKAYRSGDVFICLSRAYADILTRDYGIDESRVHVIPGGVDVAAFDSKLSRTEARARLEWHADRPTVVCVRRLVNRMGVRTLIDAIDHLRRCGMPDLCLKIVGDGPLKSMLEDHVRDCRLTQHVMFLGRLSDPDLSLAYRAADLSIVPTECLEGFGLTTLESLASGTPCLVTRVGGLPEAVSELSERLVLDGTDARSSATRSAMR